MQLDRLVAGTRTRLARGAFAGLLRAARDGAAVPAGEAGGTDALRCPGSRGNDWSREAVPGEVAQGGSAMERAMSLALPGRARPGTPPPAPPPGSAAPCGGRIRSRPLMSLEEVRLHNWLSDRLEAEAPTCSLHARVAFAAFLAADPAEGAPDPLQGFVADMLIADRTGQPVAVLLRTGCRGARPTPVEILREADLPVVDLAPRPGLADLWAEIARVLPGA